jgi:hypothetical protein
MFQKILSSLGKTFGSKNSKPPVTQSTRSAAAAPTEENISGKKGLPEKNVVKRDLPGRSPSPESICGINVKMPKYEIKKRLAVLYRRYNRAASSLDAKMRAESEMMLDAIVKVREKYFDPI